ncbi:MAG TPA: CoA-binding protein, partial [Candidatus Eisenbacteria bacterium]|nr:CoA-binding protein [Candidatus Eisenbacteria bacterium]
MKRDLTPLFSPASIAVIGASPRSDSLAGAVMRNLQEGGFAGRLAAVHPKATWEGVETVRAVDALPFIPDLTVWGVPPDVIQAELPGILERGGRGHVVLTAGFSEAGPTGTTKERDLVARVRERKGVMVGPNCMGFHVARPKDRVDASFCRVRPDPGPAAIFVQSGSVGEWLLVGMAARKLGATIKVSLGNMGDLDAVDFVEAVPRYFPEVRHIVLYLETMPQAERLMQAVEQLPKAVRVLALHGGQSIVGARAVMGHTGALAEEPALVAARLEGTGIQLVRSLTEALDAIELLERLGPNRGRRACVVTNAGGPAILAADALSREGFMLPEPSATLTQTLRATLPPAASHTNPVDLLAGAKPSDFETVLGAIAQTLEYDVIVPVFMHPVTVDAGEIATAIERGVGARSTDTVVCWMAGAQSFPARDQLRASRIAVLEEPSRVGRTLGIWASPPERETYRSGPSSIALEDRRLSGGIWGDPEVLESALTGPLHRVPECARLDDPQSIPETIGYPMYVKIETEGAPHKAKAGLLARVDRPELLSAAVTDLRATCPQGGRWLLQRAVRRGPEIYAGFLRHRGLGAFVGFGPGGATPDAASMRWIALPANRKRIEAMVNESPAASWLGKQAINAMASLVERLADLEHGGP